jgi:predicted nucleotide-binding protein
MLVGSARERTKVFVISSAEALSVAREIQNAFAHDDFVTTVWTDGVFRAGNIALESLIEAVEDSDFAVAIAHADDIAFVRGTEWPAPRDNVIFELGLFMGRLGKDRAILMEPRHHELKLPSDLAGLTTITYKFERGKDAAALIAPACNALREHIKLLGPNL